MSLLVWNYHNVPIFLGVSRMILFPWRYTHKTRRRRLRRCIEYTLDVKAMSYIHRLTTLLDEDFIMLRRWRGGKHEILTTPSQLHDSTHTRRSITFFHDVLYSRILICSNKVSTQPPNQPVNKHNEPSPYFLSPALSILYKKELHTRSTRLVLGTTYQRIK